MRNLYIAIGNGAANILDEFRNSYTSEDNQFLYLDSESEALSYHGKSMDEIVKITENFNPTTIRSSESHNVIILCCLGGNSYKQYLMEVVNSMKNNCNSILCILTLPFKFEGSERRNKAESVLNNCKSTGIVIQLFDNDDLNDELSFSGINQEIVKYLVQLSSECIK